MTSLGVLLVPIVARVLFAEPVPRSTWLAIPVALLGMAMLSLAHGFAVSAGQLYYLVAAVALAVFFTLSTRAATISTRQVTARQAATTMTAVDPFGLNYHCFNHGWLSDAAVLNAV